MINFGLVFMSVSLSLGMNIEEGMLRRFGFDPDILMVTAVAFIISGLIVHRRLALIVAVVLLSFGANVPVEEAARMGYDPDVLLAALFALVTVPLVARWMDGTGF